MNALPLPHSLQTLAIQVEDHVRDGRFSRSLSLVAGASGLLSGFEVSLEHYRGSYGQKIMYSPVVLSAILAGAGGLAAVNPAAGKKHLSRASALLILDGVVGFGFHVRGIARKPGGWRRNLVANVVMGPPIFAPLLLGIGGLLGLVAARLHAEESGEPVSPAELETIRKCLAGATAASAFLNGFEALYSHYKAGFNSRSQWIPIVLTPPLVAVGALAVPFPRQTRAALGTLSVLAIAAGTVGAGFHINGIRKRPGGFSRPFYNAVYGPPALAPLLFAATGFLGLLAIEIGRERRQAQKSRKAPASSRREECASR